MDTLRAAQSISTLQAMGGHDGWAVLAQIAPTDPNNPWMWLSGILATAVVALFGLYTKKLADDAKEWKATAKESATELTATRTTINTAVDTLQRQGTLIEKALDVLDQQRQLLESNTRELVSAKELLAQTRAELARLARELEDLRLGRSDRRRPTGE